MKCSFCGYDFDPAEAYTSCGDCPIIKGCRLIRCPRCGYEMPPEAKLLGWLRRWRDRRSKQGVFSSIKQQ